eukprot:7613645-Alexandrium_andersonii.AAC.1
MWQVRSRSGLVACSTTIRWLGVAPLGLPPRNALSLRRSGRELHFRRPLAPSQHGFSTAAPSMSLRPRLPRR